jgi:hypothetical protein
MYLLILLEHSIESGVGTCRFASSGGTDADRPVVECVSNIITRDEGKVNEKIGFG